MSSNDISIKAEGISKHYDLFDSPYHQLKTLLLGRKEKELASNSRKFQALNDVSFEVKKGESFGIIGRNGSGKSTLLQIITGTINPSSGSVSTSGRIGALLELGSGFNPEFTGRENVYLNGLLLGMSRDQIDDRFDKIAGFADIGAHLDQPVKTYSSGMLVRLAFSVQVQLEPDILIIDEALAVGDALFQRRCYERIERLLADGITFILVSHDQESIRTLTHNSMLLHQGNSIFLGNSSEAILKYRKLLHDEESKYFASLVDKIEDVNTSIVDPIDPDHQIDGSQSFGDGGVRVVSVLTFDGNGEACNIFYPGDKVRLCISCMSEIEIDHLNIGLRIRNREGLKIYSWGTLNQDMQIIAGLRSGDLFWNKNIKKGARFKVWYEFECRMGPNLYEIQASVSYEAKPDYTEQRILHWKDEAAFFQVLMRTKEYFFGGSADLQMSANW